MPLSDRDDLHARSDSEDPPLRFRPASRQPSVGVMVLCIAAGVFALYRAALWWEDAPLDRHQREQAPPATPAMRAPSQAVHAPKDGAPSAAQLPTGTVTKCVARGRVSYTDAACPAGAQAMSLTLAPPNLLQAVPITPAATAPVMQSSPTVEAAPAALAPAPIVQAMPPVATNDMQCKALNAQVRQIDLITLQPLPLPTLDYYREVQRKLRDQQFALGC